MKTSQAKVETEVANIIDRLERADVLIMDLEVENAQLDKEVKQRARQYEELQRSVRGAVNRQASQPLPCWCD